MSCDLDLAALPHGLRPEVRKCNSALPPIVPGVHVGEMGEIHQVIDEQFPSGFQVVIHAAPGPLRPVVPRVSRH